VEGSDCVENVEGVDGVVGGVAPTTVRFGGWPMSDSEVPSSLIIRYPPYVTAAAAIKPSQIPILMP
jgi:hypothetical protein